MSACTQCHGQGGFSYRRQNGASAFAICTNCRGHRFVDDDVPPPPPKPSQLPPWPAPRRHDRISIAGRWLTIGGCLDIWPSGRMKSHQGMGISARPDRPGHRALERRSRWHSVAWKAARRTRLFSQIFQRKPDQRVLCHQARPSSSPYLRKGRERARHAASAAAPSLADVVIANARSHRSAPPPIRAASCLRSAAGRPWAAELRAQELKRAEKNRKDSCIMQAQSQPPAEISSPSSGI